MDWRAVVTIGIDLGDRFSHYCALSADGTIVTGGRVATTLRLIYENQRKSDRAYAEYLARVARLDPKLRRRALMFAPTFLYNQRAPPQ